MHRPSNEQSDWRGAFAVATAARGGGKEERRGREDSWNEAYVENFTKLLDYTLMAWLRRNLQMLQVARFV